MVGCSHHSTPLEVRERIALPPERLARLREALLSDPLIAESFVLHTCNRLEIYGSSPAGAGETLEAQLARHLQVATTFTSDEAQTYAYTRDAEEAVRHLYEVAAGLDSQLLGETEIFGQVKSAYESAQQVRSVGPVLHRLLQKTFQAAKWARTHTGIGQGQVSLGNVAVDLAERIFGRIAEARTLVVGSGEIGREVARALHSRGTREIAVTSRQLANAQALAAEVGGETIPFNAWAEKLRYVDIAVFATASPGALLTEAIADERLPERHGQPLFLVDLAMPRDVAPEVGERQAVFLYNLQDLAEIANRNRAMREAEVNRCRTELRERAANFWRRLRC
jgi:glutamyl-tRNA reductase